MAGDSAIQAVPRGSEHTPRSELDSRPTVDVADDRPHNQLQMERLYLRLQHKLFGPSNTTVAHYAVVRPIGQGAMGLIYQAVDLRLGREVALKLVLPDLLKTERGKSRLLREARAMAKISHPNVVAVYDVGESGEVVFVAMELVRGVTVRKWLEVAPRTLAEILDVFAQAGAGLAAAHQAGIVHRDFKPDNVVVGEDGRARVLDFGLAFPSLPSLSSASMSASTVPGGGGGGGGGEPAEPPPMVPDSLHSTGLGPGVLAGTIVYMSPEQLLLGPLDARSDQFGFCVALYEALYGQRPFGGRTFLELVENVRQGVFAPVAERPRLPSWLVAVILRGLSSDPEQRYASMPELVSLLAAGRQLLAHPASQSPPSPHRESLLAELEAVLDEPVAASASTALLRVSQLADRVRRLVIAAHDPSAPQLRASFAAYFDRTRGAETPDRLRPLRLVRSEAGLALVFPDVACVLLGGLIRQAEGRQTAGREPVLALQLARSLTRTAYALAQVGYAIDPGALESLPVCVERYEIGPIDPAHLVELGAGGGARYRIVGAMLAALLPGSEPRRSAEPGAAGGAGGPGGAGGADDHVQPASIRAVVARLLEAEAGPDAGLDARPGAGAAGGYRSARGLLHDLTRCLDELQQGRSHALFPLGTRDLGGPFTVSAVLRGRRRELETFDAMARELGPDSSGLVLVSGPSGIGKTQLLDELGARLGRGRRICGTFDPHASHEPFATLAHGLRGLIGQILDEPDSTREAWRARIVQAVAPNAELLVPVIPELRYLIGDQPAVPAIPPVESAARFGETLRRLLIACAAQVELLAVVLDDMQWCDPSSIQLIHSLLGDREAGKLLWICAFRDAEHPLHVLLSRCEVGGPPPLRLPIGPLSRDELHAFLTDTLGCTPERAAPLARFFHDRTDGNPLFARTLLTSLFDQGLFTFSPRQESWCWDDAAIRSAELPRDLQELLARTIESLSAPAQQLLAVASCAGRDLEVPLLVEVVARLNAGEGWSRAELVAGIRECVARGLVESAAARPPVGSGVHGPELVNFTHDRVQQTAHGLVGRTRREAVLLETGRALLDRLAPHEVAEKVFRIVGYLNSGAAQADRALGDRIVELDLLAAQRALAANAFADSVHFLDAALALLPEDRWSSRYDQTVELYVQLMHAHALLGDRVREDALFELLRTHVRTAVHLGRIYELKVLLESSRGEHQTAIVRGVAGLRALGEELPVAPGRAAAMLELGRTWRALYRVDVEELCARPSARTEDLPASRLLVALSAPAYLADSNLLAIVMMRLVQRSLRFGMSDVSSHGFAGFGMILSGLLRRYEQARRFALVAHQLDDRFGNPWLRPKVDLMSGLFIQPWTRPFEHCEQLLARGFTVAAGNADFFFASYLATSGACLQYYRGDTLANVADAATAALRHTHRTRDDDMGSVVTTLIHAARCLRGQTAGPTDFSMPDRRDDRRDADFLATLDERTTPIGVFFARAIRCGVLYLHGRADLACELGEQAAAYEYNTFSNPSLPEYLFYYAMALMRESGAPTRRARKVIDRALDRFAAWARDCPENFEARHTLLQAEVDRLDGRGTVVDRLHLALELAARHRRVQHEALAAELLARHCEARGLRTVAQIHLECAIRAYRRWGAAVKAQQLESRLLPAT